jgi:hypothetical protein
MADVDTSLSDQSARQTSGEKIHVARTVPEPYPNADEALRRRPAHLIGLAYLSPTPTSQGSFRAVLSTRRWRRWIQLPACINFTATAPQSEAVIHITWNARFHPRLFPTMEADLVLHPLSASTTELNLFGNYRPPLGLLGLVFDRLIGGRVAVATANAFMDDLSDALVRDMDATHAEVPGDVDPAPEQRDKLQKKSG